MLFSMLRKNVPDFINIAASLAFFFGSLLFLPRFSHYATIGVWLFMLGSCLMFVGCIVALIKNEDVN